MGGSPLASSSSRPSKTASASTSGGGRFEYAVDRSPLQKLELELKIISNEESDVPKPGITRTLSRHQAERLQQSATVTSRLEGNRVLDPYTQNPNRASTLYESMGPKSTPKEYAVSSGNNKEHKHGRLYKYFHGRRGSSSSGSDSSSSENNTKNGTAKVHKEPVARLTIEDTELIEHHTDELLSENPEPDYAMPYHEEGMLFTLSETLSSGLIILPRSPDTPIFHMIQNPLLQQRRVLHPYRPGKDAESRYPKPRRLSTATTASFSSPNLLDPAPGREPSEVLPYQSTSTLMQYLNVIPSRPVPEPSIFTPKLYVKCGPLLRYVGLRRDGVAQKATKRGHAPTAKEEREVWRGTIMIVTTDDRSSYNPPPRLRLFVQSIELLTGDGIREPTGRRDSVSSLWRKKDGEKQRKFKDVVGTRLLSEKGVTWWRFTIEIELTDKASFEISIGAYFANISGSKRASPIE